MVKTCAAARLPAAAPGTGSGRVLGSEPGLACRPPSPLIDTSTPESLERDFYAWLWGWPKSEVNSVHNTVAGPDEEAASPQSSSSFCSSGSASVSASRSASSCSCASFEHNKSNNNSAEDNNNNEDNKAWQKEWRVSGRLPPFGALFRGAIADATLPYYGDYDGKGGSKSAQELNNNNSSNNKCGNTAKSNNNSHKGDNNKCPGTNQLGRTYSPGLPLSMRERERIVDLYRGGWKICDISKQLCVTHSCVSKILHRFRTTGTWRPKDAKEGRQESPLVEAIRDYRLRLGLTRQSEIREQLIRDGWCQRATAPSRSSINQ